MLKRAAWAPFLYVGWTVIALSSNLLQAGPAKLRITNYESRRRAVHRAVTGVSACPDSEYLIFMGVNSVPAPRNVGSATSFASDA
jgi:hypothetical protein